MKFFNFFRNTKRIFAADSHCFASYSAHVRLRCLVKAFDFHFHTNFQYCYNWERTSWVKEL